MAVLSDKQFLWLAGGAVVAVVALGWLAKQKAAEVVKHVNPADSGNIANRAHEAWWQFLTGQEEGGIGIWLADKLNPPEKFEQQVLPSPRYD